MTRRGGAATEQAITSRFWQGKRVLVTGHTGFKGSWLSLWLTSMGAEVVGFALPPATQPSMFELAGIETRMTSEIGDIRTRDLIREVVHRHTPEIVFHLAAQPLVRRSYQEPIETYDTNVMGTVHLLETARHAPSVRAIVCVTSDKCYGEGVIDHPYREGDPMGGFDPYSSSKGCCELVVDSYRSSYFSSSTIAGRATGLASARAGNVIGGGDWSPDRLIVDVVRAFRAGRPARIRNPDAMRPWQHVLEPLAGYLRLAERLWVDPSAVSGPWNFGPDPSDVRSVAWVVDELTILWADGASWRIDTDDHPHEAKTLLLDSSKARTLLGWAPKLSLKQSLAWTVEWYRACDRGTDMAAFTLEQISRHASLAETTMDS